MQIVVDINLSFVVSSQVPMRQKHTQKHTWVRGPVGSFWRGTLKFMQDIKILTCLSTVLSSKLCWLRHLHTLLQLGSKLASFCMWLVLQHCVFDRIIANILLVEQGSAMLPRSRGTVTMFLQSLCFWILNHISEQAQVSHDLRCFAIVLFVLVCFGDIDRITQTGPNYPELRFWMQLGW